jgi:hypothetical protein
MLGSGTSGQKSLRYFLTVHVSHSAMAPEGGSCSPRCLPTRATVVSIKARKSNWHWSTRLRTTLAGPGVHLQGRSLGSRPANHEGTDDPEEDIGLRSETIVAHDLAGGPTRQPSGKGNKQNGTFPPWITNTSSKKVSLLGVWYVSGTRLKVHAA